MSLEILKSVWPVLALLTYLLVVASSRVLGAQWRAQIDVHDRVRASRELRRQYLASLEARQHGEA